MPGKAEYKGLSIDTKRLLAGQESRDVDFKRSHAGVKPELFVAFANTRGGTILVGVDEIIDANGIQRGKVVGCEITDEVKQGLVSSAASCRPSIDIDLRIENIGTTYPIIRIDVAEGADKPYASFSGTYKIRAEGQNIALDPAMMKSLILDKEADQFIARFQYAAEELIGELIKVKSELAKQIKRVECAASEAIEAARAAEAAAENAARWAAS